MKLFQGRNNSLRHRVASSLTRLWGNYPQRLPDFLVVGATRSGSTTLNRVLSAHPQIFVPRNKELHYFDNDALYRPDLAGYRELFGGYRGECFIGEVTPSYCDKGAIYDASGKMQSGLDDDPIRRIAKAMPEVRLIISLRDPLTRIRSMYLKNFNQGKLSHSMEDELKREVSGTSVLRLVRRCQYHESIQHILAHFPAQNFKVMIFEEWTRDQAIAFSELFSFIGADPKPNVTLNPVASNNAERYRKGNDSRTPEPDLSPETRRRVIEATAESRAWLEDFLGRELPWVRA